MYSSQRWSWAWPRTPLSPLRCRWKTLFCPNCVMALVRTCKHVVVDWATNDLTFNAEEGDYLALDLGGTNFRVILLRIKAGAVVGEEVQYYQVPEDVRLGEGVKLFDFLAECIHNFMDGRQLKGQNLPLGFTFSFPMTQRGLDVGILVSWTKSFNCSGVVGEDAVKMLNDAIHRRKDTDVDVIAVLNDTTGKFTLKLMVICHFFFKVFMRSCQISYIFRNFGPRRFRRQEMRHRIDSGHWKQRLLHRTSRSHRKMGRRAQRCQRGRHRCRVGRFWRQRSLGFHQNRIRQTSRQEFATSRFLHVSFTFKNIKKT